MPNKLLITGGAGKIGSCFARFAADHYALRTIDRTQPRDPLPGETLVGDLHEIDVCRAACQDMDMVIHLAADADPDADFLTSLLPNNIIATYNMFRAAHEAGCQRFIYASSAHVVSAYPPDIQINANMPVRPRNLYGVSKCFGEALAAYYAYTVGLPTVVLRIGAYIFPDEYAEFSHDELDAFLSPDDFNQLLIQCLETPDITFAIAHALSDNRFKRLDLTATRDLFGYHPTADAFNLFGIFPEGK